MEDTLLPWASAGISLGGSLIGYGMMREKVARLEKDLDEHKKVAITLQHFDAVIKPIRDTMREMRDDIKTLLNDSRRHNDDE